MPFRFDNSYARLPPRFFGRVAPTPVRAPALLKVNRELARSLGADADALESPEGVDILAGNLVPEGAEPIALAYAGHQFGGFVPQLGDGRAILLGEVASEEGRRDVQLKGSGRTPYSRGGDGRAALGPVLREYVVSEAMAALGIPTTRALAAVRTGEPVFRERPLPGAVLTRVASSHLRVGTFQFFAARDDREGLELLLAHALARHVPEAVGAERPALALLEHFARSQAALVARWLGVGFVHGVMNTDNSSIAGETLDYGPCAFVDTYAPGRTFSSIDRGGRYAFGNQPKIAQWNLARLAEAILSLVDPDPDLAESLASGVIESFPARFEEAYSAVLRRKIGLAQELDGDHAMALDLMGRLARSEVDHTLFFRRLCDAAASADADAQVAALFADPSAFHTWAEGWRQRLAGEDVTPEERAAAMRRANPAFIPRNHRIEEMIAAATEGDLAPFERLVAVLARPFEDQPDHAELAEPPGPEQAGYRTFCGT